MNKDKVYKDLKKLLKTEEPVEVISYSESGEEETGICIIESKVIKNAPMKEYTSFKVGGHADILVDPGHKDRLVKTIIYLENENIPYIIMGNGSNMVFRDGGYRGVVILTYSNVDGSNMGDVDVHDSNVTAGAGILLSTLAKLMAEDGLSGLEPISGVPGTLGGAVFMNAGAYGGEIKDIIKSVRAYDPASNTVETIKKTDMDLGYRHSIFHENGKIILDVTLELTHENPQKITATMRELTKKRNAKQPVNLPSAGSFFKRPEGFFAGKLIQDSGLKGLQRGGAQISELHSGFMVNAGDATAQDIEDLMSVVQAVVFDKFGVMMEPEVRIIGEYL